jgi:hypothetical protein
MDPTAGDSSTAVVREAAWLAAYNPNDGLPGLLCGAGGAVPFNRGARRTSAR